MLRSQQIRRFDKAISLGGAALLAVMVAGCSSGGSGTAAAAGTPTAGATSQGGQRGGPGGGGFNPGVSGVIASVSGTTLTATTSQGSTSSVKWTDSTKISSQSTGSASDLAKGACVSVRQQFSGAGGGERPSGMPSGNPTSGSRPTGSMPSYTVPSAVTASSVTILPASDCIASTATSTPSSSGAKSDGRGFGGMRGLTGKVTSVTNNGFVFQTTGSTAKSVTVTTSSSTTYTKESSATASAIQAGKCVEARGTTANSVLTATSLTISESVNGECTSQMEGFGGGNGGAPNAS
ncbi:DUF5666 domain-containing protein [Branchiibius sp. NY16-3462-2]|uniref:DUF5666 domain-containing protein n=1 Tax=Branchiibius sp. NY16-3462-2 TaxID=1807500 RepID=UPI000791672F|nr:DUF5666 domain-containing protein [Branchiibius sp. NY16-3462-2]KYH44521.1 hypothetical protein AZH51_08440 [Branchiibius sp. NY16-3462-2]